MMLCKYWTNIVGALVELDAKRVALQTTDGVALLRLRSNNHQA